MTQKQQRFCEEYLANGYNIVQAYRKAYPNDKQEKPSYPYRMMKNPEIVEYISKRRQEIYDGLNIDALRVQQELAEIAFADKNDPVYTPQNKLKALEQLAKIMGLQVQKIENRDVIEVSLED